MIQDTCLIIQCSTGIIFEAGKRGNSYRRVRGRQWGQEDEEVKGNAVAINVASRRSDKLLKATLSLDQMSQIYICLTMMGLPNSLPEIDGIPDTSICHGTATVQGTIGSVPFHFSFWMMHSGFEGRHAPWFVKFLGIMQNVFDSQLEYGLLTYG